MATYQDFEAKAKKDGLFDGIAQKDIELARRNPDAGIAILDAKNNYNSATTDSARALAHAEAQNIRKQNGFILDQTGKFEVRSPDVTEPSPTTAPTQTNEYRRALEEESRKAQEDVLGKAAALTGGYASSSAIGQAAAVGTDYAKALAEMEQKHKDADYQKRLNEAQIAAGLGNYTLLNALGIDTSAYEKAQADNAAKSQADTEYSRAWQEAETAAKYGDPSRLRALGINADLTQKTVRGAESGAVGADKSEKPILTLSQAISAADNGVDSDNVRYALDYYYGDGYYDGKYGQQLGDSVVKSDMYGKFRLLASNALENPSQGNDAAYQMLLNWVNNKRISPEEATLIASELGIIEPTEN